MTRRIVAVIGVAIAMAMAGIYLLFWRIGHAEPPWVLPQLIVVSIIFWQWAARLIRRRSLILLWGLLIGLASPLIGGFFVPFGIWVVLKFPEICFPVGVLTGYWVWRIMTSPWSGWTASRRALRGPSVPSSTHRLGGPQARCA